MGQVEWLVLLVGVLGAIIAVLVQSMFGKVNKLTLVDDFVYLIAIIALFLGIFAVASAIKDRVQNPLVKQIMDCQYEKGKLLERK